MGSARIDPPAGAPPARPARRAVARATLEACWDPIHDTLRPLLPGVLGDALGPVAKGDDEDAARLAKTVLLRDRAFAAAFLEHLHTAYVAAVGAFVEPPAEGARHNRLTLVEVAAVAHETLIEQTAARLRNGVDEPYIALKLRLANLAGEFDLRDSELPFRTSLFVQSVAAALHAAGAGETAVAGWLRLFPPVLTMPVAACLGAVDEFLQRRGVQAQLVARPAASRDPGRMSASYLGLPGAAVAGTATQVLDLLQRRLHLGSAGFLPAMPAAGGAASMVAAAPAAALLEAIERLQRLGAMALAAGATGPVPGAAGMGEQLAAAAEDRIDKLTIELVDLVFERIQRDRHVPEEIKDLLARLHLPLLKVALTDPDLFVGADQPARRLLDRIASTAIGWSPAGEDNQRYLAEVRAVVRDVLVAAGDASAAFDRAYVRFEQFLERERTRDDDPVARARRALAEAEQREVRAIKTTMQVRSAFDGVQLESYLRDFLLYAWVRVLIEASDRDPAGGLLRRLLDVVPDLVWSVQPKLNLQDRQRMLSLIPGLLAVLREGLAMIEWPERKVDELLARLMASHAQAVRALELAHGSVAPVATSTLRIKLDGFRVADDTGELRPEQIEISDDAVRHVLHARGAPVSHLSAPGDDGLQAPEIDHERAGRMAASWRCGSWFELQLGGRFERVRLDWISPRGALYLFSTPDAARALSLSPANLIAYVQSGWLRPLEQEPFFARVVKGVLHQLEHAGRGATPAAP